MYVYFILFSKIIMNFALENECTSSTFTSCSDKWKLCDRICENEICEIRAIVILPKENTISSITLDKVIPILEQAKQDIYDQNILPNWLNISLIGYDDECSETYAQFATIESYMGGTGCPHVFFGPICEFAVATVSRIMKFFGSPQFCPGGLSIDFERPKQNCNDDYYMMLRTSSLFFQGISLFLKSLIVSFHWKRVLFLYDENGQSDVAGMKTCSLFMQTLVSQLSDLENMEYADGDLTLTTMNTTEYLKRQIGVNYGVIVMCSSYERVREILLAAESLEKMMYSGEYTFFNIELSSRVQYPDKPWIDENDSKENNTKLEQAYKSVLTLTSKRDTDETLQNSTSNEITVSHFLTDFYDSMLLYAKTLETFLNGSSKVNNYQTLVNGYDLIHRVYGSTFLGYNNETIHMDCNGRRLNKYSLLSYNPKVSKYEVVANYDEQFHNLSFLAGRQIYWLNEKNEAPSDIPMCGYDNSKCPETSFPIYAIISIVLVGFSFIIITAAIFIYRKIKLEAEINSMTWKVNWEDILDLHSTRRDSLASSLKRGSQLTINSELYSIGGDRQMFMPIGYYKNIKVAIKRLAPVKIELNRAQLIRMKNMKDFQHEHLVKFHGACLDPPNCCILTEYCPKGSLQDILENEEISLEWMIKISLIEDLVRGMTYIHQSEIKSHGNLSSTNCVVDSRFVLKITDFGMNFFKKYDAPNEDSYAFWRKQLWTAPELLRLETIPEDGTQPGDIYSFAIIVHEIVVRQGLFYLGNRVDTTPKDIITSLKSYNTDSDADPLRPYLGDSIIDKDFLSIIEKCWDESIINRPAFTSLKRSFKKFHKGSESSNILDNLLSRMEQYANNLESLVEERTADYLEEKKKCEELLYQLLPKSVATQLILGQPVIAESFDEVTIYFSDIVGFTALSAKSTPMQVVDLLNDLYTCFDSIIENFDVYKVETIGDAYMVVSGLPDRNEHLHSREIARMSLALLKAVNTFTIRHQPEEKLKLRIGLHTGPCVAGVVGLKMPRYCLFGDTVNTASRMESNGEALKIHISPITKIALDAFNLFKIEARGEIELKGKGKMSTFWLLEEQTNLIQSTESSFINIENSSITEKVNENLISKVEYPRTPAISKKQFRKSHREKSVSKNKVIFKSETKFD